MVPDSMAAWPSGETLAMVARQRANMAREEWLSLSAILDPGVDEATVLLRQPSALTFTWSIRLEASLLPDGLATAEPLPLMDSDAAAGPEPLFGGQRLGPWRSFGASHTRRVLVGPCLGADDWGKRAAIMVLTGARGEQRLAPAEPRTSVDHSISLWQVGRSTGWRQLASEITGPLPLPVLPEGEGALLIIGSPGVCLTLHTDEDSVSAREIALLPGPAGFHPIALDVALSASIGTELARLTVGEASRAVAVAEGRVADGTTSGGVRSPFSPHDAHVAGARREAASLWQALPSPWPSPMLRQPRWTSPVDRGGWPRTLRLAVGQLSPVDHALLMEWALADPVTGRLLAALRLKPDREPTVDAAGALRESLRPLMAADAAARLEVRAASLTDRDARTLVLELAAMLGQAWVSLSHAEAALSVLPAMAVALPRHAVLQEDDAARALIARWEEAAGEPGFLASLDPSQDPLQGASQAPALPMHALATLSRQSEAIEHGLRALGPVPVDTAAALRRSGLLLAFRQLVRRADARAGLADMLPEDDEDMALRRALLRRMRTALPEHLDRYLELAGGDAAADAAELDALWGRTATAGSP